MTFQVVSMRIDGKVVLITGASEGIGAACAAEFARAGAKLSLTARSEEGLKKAGAGTYLPSWNMPLEEARGLMELNFFALLEMTQLVVPDMRARHSGTIVNIGSIGGKMVLPWSTLYRSAEH